jgi:hypothetical protein
MEAEYEVTSTDASRGELRDVQRENNRIPIEVGEAKGSAGLESIWCRLSADRVSSR